MTPSITIAARSEGLDETSPTIVVTLPTFRRPHHLVATLNSLTVQRTRRRFAVIVMENDAQGREGLDAASPFFTEGRLAGLVLIAHDRGNCSAYNAGWATALAEFPTMEHCLVIDDDECAGEDWIENLVATAEALGTDFVGAPQVPIFENGHSAWLTRHPIFMPHYHRTGVVPILYSSGNVLIRRHVLEAMGAPFLDTAFNFIGGGDSNFYSRCRDRGFRFGWCSEAPVFETQPARRTEFSWINARSLRNGAISLLIEHRRDTSAKGRLRALVKSLAMLAASPLRGLALGLRTRSPIIGLYFLQVALGRLQAELGAINEQYRQPERN